MHAIYARNGFLKFDFLLKKIRAYRRLIKCLCQIYEEIRVVSPLLVNFEGQLSKGLSSRLSYMAFEQIREIFIVPHLV